MSEPAWLASISALWVGPKFRLLSVTTADPKRKFELAEQQ